MKYLFGVYTVDSGVVPMLKWAVKLVINIYFSVRHFTVCGADWSASPVWLLFSHLFSAQAEGKMSSIDDRRMLGFRSSSCLSPACAAWLSAYEMASRAQVTTSADSCSRLSAMRVGQNPLIGMTSEQWVLMSEVGDGTLTYFTSTISFPCIGLNLWCELNVGQLVHV